jgi:tetratricopeptide (TPR) repeat protein
VLESDCLGLAPAMYRAKVIACQAFSEHADGQDPRETLKRAIEAYTGVIQITSGRSSLHARGLAYLSLAEAQEQRGEDPEPSYTRAYEDFTENLKLGDTSIAATYNIAVSHSARANAGLGIGLAKERKGEDPESWYEGAVRDSLAAVHSHPTYTPALNAVPSAVGLLARHMAARGVPVEGRLRAWLAEAEAAAGREPAAWQPHLDRAVFLELLGSYEEAAAACRVVLERCPELEPGDPWVTRIRTSASRPAWVRDLEAGDRMISWGDYAGSREVFERGLAAAEAAGAAADKANRDALVGANYNLACALSRLSAGMRTAGAKAGEIPPEQAKALRSRAVDRLRRAFELGWPDLDHVKKDPDLDPLREHPEFRGLVDEWERKLSGK